MNKSPCRLLPGYQCVCFRGLPLRCFHSQRQFTFFVYCPLAALMSLECRYDWADHALLVIPNWWSERVEDPGLQGRRFHRRGHGDSRFCREITRDPRPVRLVRSARPASRRLDMASRALCSISLNIAPDGGFGHMDRAPRYHIVFPS